MNFTFSICLVNSGFILWQNSHRLPPLGHCTLNKKTKNFAKNVNFLQLVSGDSIKLYLFICKLLFVSVPGEYLYQTIKSIKRLSLSISWDKRGIYLKSKTEYRNSINIDIVFARERRKRLKANFFSFCFEKLTNNGQKNLTVQRNKKPKVFKNKIVKQNKNDLKTLKIVHSLLISQTVNEQFIKNGVSWSLYSVFRFQKCAWWHHCMAF